MSAGEAIDWRGQSEVDKAMIDALVTAVGLEAFTALRLQFIEDLQRLAAAYQAARGEDDAKASREATHALRGAALNVGLLKLGHLAGALERGEHDDEAELPQVLRASITGLMSAGSA